ncbi:MAG: M48 family metallopeptidase [Pseudobdellovibrionaceae bacterium]
MQSRVRGLLFNGQTSKPVSAELVVEGELIFFEGDGEIASSTRYKISDLRISEPLGSIPRVIEAGESLRFETSDFAGVSALKKKLSVGIWVHGLENSWTYAVGSAAFMVLALLYAYFILIPKYSSELARHVPPWILEGASSATEKLLSEYTIDATELKEEELQRFELAVADLQVHFPELDIRVDIIGKMDPNAFIVSNGHIFITQSLLAKLETPEEVLSVLLHEMGHYHHHHLMESVIENSALSLLLVAISGGTDWTSIPLVVLSTKYSRENEAEADDFAVDSLIKMGKSPLSLKTTFEKLNAHSSFDMPEFLLTHPNFDRRIEKIKKAPVPSMN